MRKERVAILAMLLLIATVSRAHADPADDSGQPTEETQPTAPYLLSGAPTFDLTLVKFRESYNRANPTLPLSEFHAITIKDDLPPLTRAASKINENLYASTALEKGTGKIKTLQITYLPIKGGEEKAARLVAVNYMAALMRQFEAAKVPFLFKQWGEWAPEGDLSAEARAKVARRPAPAIVQLARDDTPFTHVVDMFKLGKKLSGRTLQGKTYTDFPRRAA